MSRLPHAVHRRRLDNGLSVVVTPLPHLHTATVALFVRAGSRYESPRDNGLSHFTEHMLFRGNDRYPTAHELALAIEDLGGTLDAATHVDFTTYSITLPPEAALVAIDHLGEILRSPRFDRIEVERGILREEILEGLDDDGRDVDVNDIARRQLFGAHPLGYKIAGPLANVMRFTVDDCRAHVARHYGARNLVLVASGAVAPDEVLRAAEASLADLPAGEPVTVATPEQRVARERFAYVEDDGSQTDLRITFHTVGLRHPDSMAVQMLGRILDDGLSTRLFHRICDERGLAYDVHAGPDPYEDCGVFELGVSVAHERTPELVSELLALCAELGDRGVSEEELDRARRRHAFDLAATLDAAHAMADFYGQSTVLDLEDGLELEREKALRVTTAQLREVAAAQLHPSKAHLACVGMLGRILHRKTRAALEQAG